MGLAQLADCLQCRTSRTCGLQMKSNHVKINFSISNPDLELMDFS